MQKLINLGCKVNQYEGFCLLRKFSDIDALVIVNTCCVTKEAEIKSIKKFRQAIKNFPHSFVIATGCACHIAPEKFSGAHKLIDSVARNTLIKNTLPLPQKSRYFLKIEDGCSENCSYCIVSKIREKIESKPLSAIEEEIIWATAHDYKEIVMVGANIGLYGFDLGVDLNDVIEIIKKIEYLPRVRFSSIEPKFINKKLVRGLKELPICRHFHIPFQSADDNILKKMNRGYDVCFLQDKINLIKENFDDVAIGGDVIVGFPGEGDNEFLHTIEFIEKNPFTHLHVFPYSPRPGTTAFYLGDPVPHAEKKSRLWALKKLIKQKNHGFRKQLLHKRFGVIIERKSNESEGLTDNYVRVSVNQECQVNELIDVVINDVTLNETFASVCNTITAQV